MKLLSHSQLQQLGIAATAAFKVQAAHDLLDLPLDVQRCTKSAQIEFWRQRECASITGICSFRELDQRHYLAVRDYFQKLAGITPQPSSFSHHPSDATANHWLTEMWKWAAKAGLHPSYVAIIARNKFGHVNYEQLTLEQSKQLHDTLLNRARAKLGKGHTENRNKKQRAPTHIDQPF